MKWVEVWFANDFLDLIPVSLVYHFIVFECKHDWHGSLVVFNGLLKLHLDRVPVKRTLELVAVLAILVTLL